MKIHAKIVYATALLMLLTFSGAWAASMTCEQAARAGTLGITLNNNQVTLHNGGDQQYTISVVSYKMYAALTDDQTLFDARTQTLGANESANLTITMPGCAYQFDIVCGTPLVPPEYGEKGLITRFGNQDSFCTPEQAGNVTLRLKESYGNTYVFSCDASGFAPTNYFWYYGDGQILPNTRHADTQYAYAPGNYTVACTATDGTNTGTGVLQLNVQSNPAGWPGNDTGNQSNDADNQSNDMGNQSIPLENTTNPANDTVSQTDSGASGNVTLNSSDATNSTLNLTANISDNAAGANLTTNSTLNTSDTNNDTTNSMPDQAPSTNSSGNILSASSFSSFGGGSGSEVGAPVICDSDWHKEGNNCVKNPPIVPLEQPVIPEQQTSAPPLDVASHANDAPPTQQAPAAPLDLANPDEGNAITGNVAGKGGNAGWAWPVILIGMIALAIGSYFHMRMRKRRR